MGEFFEGGKSSERDIQGGGEGDDRLSEQRQDLTGVLTNASKGAAFLLTGLRHPYAPIKLEKRRNKSAGRPNSLWEVKWAMHQGMCSGE